MTFISQQILSEGGLTGNTIFALEETEERILSTDSNKKITSLDTTTYPSLTELSYVKGVTSPIQIQLNGFVPTGRTITTTSPLNGGGDLSANRTLSIDNAAADGVTKGAATFNANDFNASSGVISIDYVNGQSAGSVQKGFLTQTDWINFNNKVGASRLINTTSPLQGGGNLGSDRTLSINNADADGVTKGAATFTSSDFNSSSGLISIDYANGQSATSSQKGFLTSSDWTTFNSKTKEVYNYNTTGQTINATSAYITGTKLPLTDVKSGTIVTWKISLSKTAAGVASPIWNVRLGAAGSITDTNIIQITSAPQTASADVGYVTIECIFRSGIGTSSVITCHLNIAHNITGGGLSTTINFNGWNQTNPAGIFINPSHFIGVSVSNGTSAVWTINQVTATMTNTL